MAHPGTRLCCCEDGCVLFKAGIPYKPDLSSSVPLSSKDILRSIREKATDTPCPGSRQSWSALKRDPKFAHTANPCLPPQAQDFPARIHPLLIWRLTDKPPDFETFGFFHIGQSKSCILPVLSMPCPPAPQLRIASSSLPKPCGADKP